MCSPEPTLVMLTELPTGESRSLLVKVGAGIEGALWTLEGKLSCYSALGSGIGSFVHTPFSTAEIGSFSVLKYYFVAGCWSHELKKVGLFQP